MADPRIADQIHVPLHNAPVCAAPTPKWTGYCRRAKGHTGRHAFYWLKASPGLVRAVWATCQVCGRTIGNDDGPVCSQCGN